MSLRLSKHINIGKFFRINISKSGIGFSAGVPGARFTSGPSGRRITLGIPGTGLTYVKELDQKEKPKKEKAPSPPRRAKPAPVVEPPDPVEEIQPPDYSTTEPPNYPPNADPQPGRFAPPHELAFAEGIKDYRAGDEEDALTHFLSAAPAEPGAAILASAILLEQGRTPAYAQAESLLEGVLESDQELPTPLIEKYLSDSNLRINITPHVAADVSIDGVGATLLLTEVYQARNKLDEAMDLLEAVQAQVHAPALTLSICELYAQREIWDGIVERASNTTVTDEVTFETMIWYGRAMQGKHLHEAAIAIFNDLLKIKKGLPPDLRNEAAYWRAASYQAMGKIAQANREFQKLYAKAPTFRDVAARVNQ
jgi:hypothetical protein